MNKIMNVNLIYIHNIVDYTLSALMLKTRTTRTTETQLSKITLNSTLPLQTSLMSEMASLSNSR